MSIPAEMLVLRPRSDIYFANVQLFRREVQAALAARESRPTILVFDASRLSLFEYTAHQAVRDTVSDLRTQGIEIWAVLPPGNAEEAMTRFREVFGGSDVRFFDSATAAVAAHRGRRDPPPKSPDPSEAD